MFPFTWQIRCLSLSGHLNNQILCDMRFDYICKHTITTAFSRLSLVGKVFTKALRILGKVGS